jgi:hypothetical protein
MATRTIPGAGQLVNSNQLLSKANALTLDLEGEGPDYMAPSGNSVTFSKSGNDLVITVSGPEGDEEGDLEDIVARMEDIALPATGQVKTASTGTMGAGKRRKSRKTRKSKKSRKSKRKGTTRRR